MVRDGYFYGIGSGVAAGLIIWLTWWPYAVPIVLLGVFSLWFFRDPERRIPDAPGAIVSPGDGKVTDVSIINPSVNPQARISIFLNVFNVHVNRAPIAGVVRDVRYRHGKFMNAMAASSAEENEQSIITVEGEGRTVIFKQIAGLIARRIICNLKPGDTVTRGQRMGLIKFGSRVDVIFDTDAAVQVKLGDHVKGGATILALLPTRQPARKSAGGQSDATQSEPREVSSWKS
ncbi:MAG TPA: phosphatidylserine decarboxylase family protein [Terriglobales bacterium]|nr:phosphatidylserine decarboxylase family protein [Terriglobales bacterium]